MKHAYQSDNIIIKCIFTCILLELFLVRILHDQSSVMIAYLIFLSVVLSLTCAQFPAVCNTEDSLSTKTCCPDNCGSRGNCVNIREEIEKSWESANATIVDILRGRNGWPQDLRYQWPLKIFEKVCSCDEGWGGYDCSHCDFGFIANEAGECVKRSSNQLFIRRNFRHLSEQERLNLITLLEAAKNEEGKEWAAVASAPERTNGHYTLQNVSTYDMMVVTHILTAGDKLSPYCGSLLTSNASVYSLTFLFAHFAPPFLPWHRYFVLKFESELRRIGERIGISDFTLPYWDWTPTSTCQLFTYNMFGTPETNENLVNVSGTLFENGKWPVVCDLMYRIEVKTKALIEYFNPEKCAQVRTVCDVIGDRMANHPLQRGAWRDSERNLRIPDYKLVAMSLTPNQYDGNLGFESRVEVYVNQCASETVKCMNYEVGSLNMHGLVHAYLGGHMSVGGPSANDPVFFLHHSNVDRIYERWLQKYNGTPPSYHPISGGPPGHNLNDYIVPMFPLKKIADFYKESKELGYIYDEMPWDIPSTDYQEGCPSEQCEKGGYPPTVQANSTSAYCTRMRTGQK